MASTHTHTCEVLTGDYRALEGEFVSRVRRLRRADALSPLVVIATSRLLGLHLKRHLAENGIPHINIRFLTIEDLAELTAGPIIHAQGKTRMPGFASTLVMAETLRSVASETHDFYFSGIIDRYGFHDAMHATLRDLEQAALSPDDLRQAIKKPGVRKAAHLKKLEDLTAVWTGYRCLLDELAWVDDHQVMRAATEHLASSPLVRGASSFLVYGFYDLNALQKRLLEKCMAVKDMVAFVPFENHRAFDFARPTLGWMKAQGFRARRAAPAGDSWESPALAHLRQHLFGEGAEALPHQDAVTVVSAPGEVREVREILRLIAGEAERRELRSPDVGIILRDPTVYGDIFRETFEHLKIEPYVPEGRPLSGTVEGRSVLLLLEVLARNYARSEVMEFITFAPLGSKGATRKTGGLSLVHRWDSASIAAGIVEGRNEWEERLTRLINEYRSPDDPETSGYKGTHGTSFDSGDVESLRRFMRKLATLLEALGRAKTWTDKSTALTKALRELAEDGPYTSHVTDAIARLGELDALPSPPHQAGFIQAVRECLDSESIGLGRFERQGPAVMGLMAARGIPFEMVVIPGMTEKSFPPIIRQDAILLDHEREALNKAMTGAGPLHLKSRRRLDEERLLFRLAVGAARQKLVMTFPRLSIGTARERLPSSFVLAAVEALTGRKAYFDTVESAQGFRRVPLAEIAVSEPGEAVDQVEFDLSTALENIRRKTPGGILFLRRYSTFFAEGLRLEAARWGEHHFTVYDGVLAGADALKLLEHNYGIIDRKVSPTRLENYAACPFGYLLGYILGIDPLVEPEQARTISPWDKGELVHTILWKFFTTLKQKMDQPITIGPNDIIVLRSIAGEVFRRFEETGVVGYPVMWDLEKEKILTWLDGFLEEETDQGEFHPTYFEVRYGMKTRTSEESEISTDTAVPIEFGKRRISLRGKIDRIDVSEDGRRAKIIDYKTGKPHAKEDDFQGGTTLQLPLYIHAAQQILKPLHPGIGGLMAEYYHLAVRGKKRHIGFSGDRLAGKYDELTGILDTIADGIAGGLFFPLAGDLCRWCGFALACGSRPGQILERKWLDPRAEAFLKMRGEIAAKPGEGEIE